MRSLRSELCSLLTVLTVPVLVVVVFPYAGLGFKATATGSVRRPFAAFVSLSPEEEEAAVRSAKTSWRGEVRAADDSRGELVLGELPSPDASPVLGVESRSRRPADSRPQLRLPAFLPSQAAPAPQPLPADEEVPPPAAFSRQELLEIH